MYSMVKFSKTMTETNNIKDQKIPESKLKGSLCQ